MLSLDTDLAQCVLFANGWRSVSVLDDSFMICLETKQTNKRFASTKHTFGRESVVLMLDADLAQCVMFYKWFAFWLGV